MGYWQAKVWDPAVGSTGFEEFCAALAQPLGHARARLLDYDAETQTVALPGGLNVPKVVYNYAQYIKEARRLTLLMPLRHLTVALPELRIAMHRRRVGR